MAHSFSLPEFEENLPPQQKSTTLIIWAALLASTLIYGLVLVQLIGHQSESMVPFFAHSLFLPLVIAGMGTTAMAWFLPLVLWRQAGARLAVLLRDDFFRQVIPNYQSGFVLRMALSEAVTVYGFLLAFQSHDLRAFLAFAAVGMALQLLSFPGPKTIAKALGIEIREVL